MGLITVCTGRGAESIVSAKAVVDNGCVATVQIDRYARSRGHPEAGLGGEHRAEREWLVELDGRHPRVLAV